MKVNLWFDESISSDEDLTPTLLLLMHFFFCDKVIKSGIDTLCSQISQGNAHFLVFGKKGGWGLDNKVHQVTV